MDFAISEPTKDEVPALLALIRELARFEKLEDEVEATVESLTESLSRPVCRAEGGILFERKTGCGEQP